MANLASLKKLIRVISLWQAKVTQAKAMQIKRYTNTLKRNSMKRNSRIWLKPMLRREKLKGKRSLISTSITKKWRTILGLTEIIELEGRLTRG